jgi:hypothetical protein
MRIFWWQGGVHIEPKNSDEARKLVEIMETLKNLEITDPQESIPTSPGAKLDDQQSVVGVNQAL